MNKHFRSIELDKILSLVADIAVSDACKEKILNTKPNTDFETVLTEIDKTDEAFVLSAKFGPPGLRPLEDIKSSIERAKTGAMLSLKELITIRSLLNSVSRISAWYTQVESSISLKHLFTGLIKLSELERTLNSSIISETELSDDASQELSAIRRKIISKDNQIRDKLSKIMKSTEFQKKLQDNIVTLRDGRFVIPVKAESKNEVPGLVHDTSSSGATFFIEPMSVVELNNEIKDLQAKEQAEIERIIRELSTMCANEANSILFDYDLLIELEYYFAKATFASRTNSCKPKINNEGKINLIKARHPLIPKEKVVPVDIKIGYENTVMIITGPNTGGKTVALKTTGLLTAMVMCGMLIPVSTQSEISVFDNILVDIGDEQSIENDLSTFSSHMTNLVDILNCVTPSSLVLLDEVGSGTDPAEGAALAVSIINYLKSLGCRILTTTHYQELKLYATTETGIINASCEFNVEEMKPTYKLIVGVPGKSNAFVISKKLGLSDYIIDNAKKILKDEDTRFEEAIENLEKTRAELDTAKAQIEADRIKAKNIREKLENKQKEIDKIAKKEIDNAKEMASRLIDSVKAKYILIKGVNDTNSLIDELEDIRKSKEKEDFIKRELEAKSALNKRIDALSDTVEDTEINKDDNYVLPRKLKAGDTVTMKGSANKGTVKSLTNDSATVQFGMMSMKVKIKDLRLVEIIETDKKKNKGKVSKSVIGKAEREIRQELDLRGFTVDEALMEVDRYIDGCVMTGVHSFTCIHGKGTGALRSAIQQFLRHHPHVRTFRLGVYGEGESGVTIVELK